MKYEEFITVNNWFFEKYFAKMCERYWTCKIGLNLFLQNEGKNIIETGCMRQKDDWGGGCSTLIFGDFCNRYNRNFWTCDTDGINLRTAMKETIEFKESISYIEANSLDFLEKFESKIDFLFLDSLDCEPDDFEKTKKAQNHQLKEIEIAMPKLSSNAIVLLDDNRLPWGGKTKLSKKFLLDKGWKLLMDFQQSLFIR